MKYLLSLIFYELLLFIQLVKSDETFFTNLSAGKYRLIFNTIVQCKTTGTNNFVQLNWYMSKSPSNVIEIKGNSTNTIPIDDSLDIEINMAAKDAIGGWKENFHKLKSTKACSTVKRLLGKAWAPITHGLGMKNATCPIPVGSYVATGADMSLIERDSNFPKIFFYGTYKLRLIFSEKNEVRGCILFIIQLKRP